ncbi:BBE domain-containing protein [Tenacibaculum sp. ZS6-P6]|uniref:BBE domain-containing protein n=1 Tax=Tenacibaculum sp. ZS6-P6 TaxID=3447503 RepID=UPI003F9A56C1
MSIYTLEINKEEVEVLKKKFRNDKITPVFYEPKDSGSYNLLRKVFNKRFDFMLSLIFHPYTKEYVATAIEFFSSNNFQFTVKSEGHDNERKYVAEKVIPTREYVNRALDWMEECRDYQIDETDGSFISFKDNSVPTKNYFSQNYDALIKIKETYSEDEKFLFRSRKTII